jgi:hypothetical protein
MLISINDFKGEGIQFQILRYSLAMLDVSN